jgi:hypothetical protein
VLRIAASSFDALLFASFISLSYLFYLRRYYHLHALRNALRRMSLEGRF